MWGRRGVLHLEQGGGVYGSFAVEKLVGYVTNFPDFVVHSSHRSLVIFPCI